jgi:beta-galactosidase GanA
MLAVLLGGVLAARSFKIVGDEFQMDGKPFTYVSGSFHYFQQQPERWDDTLKKMAAGGLNAVQTYVAWNIHEPTPGVYNWEGLGDIITFLTTAAKYNLYVILRPGPYICGEWEFGGFPYWLIKDPELVVRTDNAKYLQAVKKWFGQLFKKLKPHLYVNGGNIIMVQIENEYGSYPTCSQSYLKALVDTTRGLLGSDVQLFTTDGSGEGYLKCGSIINEAYATVDFGCGSDPMTPFKLERRWNNGHGPYVNSEFYAGWLDHWGERHAHIDASYAASSLDLILQAGASVNIYMYFGGTNFGLMNGANGGKNSYAPDPTSYDYDAPLTEAGDLTVKWAKIRDVIKKYRPIPTIDVQNYTKKAYGDVIFTQGVTFFESIDVIAGSKVHADDPVTMESLDVAYGFSLYRSTTTAGKLDMPVIHDRAYVYVNQNRYAVVEGHGKEAKVAVEAGSLDILVENQGRLNYGGEFVEFKGLPSGVNIGSTAIKGWDCVGVDLNKISKLVWSSNLPKHGPAFYRGTFEVDTLADTFLNPTGWVKGLAWVNGHLLGRYWTIGPQLTLYCPASFLKTGANEVIIFELEATEAGQKISFDAVHQISITP